MPDPDSPIGAVFQTLGFALFIRDETGVLRLASEPPPWLKELWPGAAQIGAVLDAAELPPFLENFLIDAAECWALEGGSRAVSGPWVERAANGADLQLEAAALFVNNQAVLLIEQLGGDFEDRKLMLQKARENVIAYQRLNAEMQKKEILLHCIAEDMTGALGNVITSLRLIELEIDPRKIRRLLDMAMLATEEQQNLIHRVLDVFAEELQSLYGRSGKSRADADVNIALQSAAKAVAAQYLEKKVSLSVQESRDGMEKVAVEESHLKRVLVNLLENALQAAPSAGKVEARILAEPDAVLVEIDDGGPGISEEMSEKLFSKFDPADPRPQSIALRLHFCRIAIENCSGEIGHSSLGTHGNRFWIRLPRSHPAP